MSRNFCEYIYIIREREFVRFNEPIYKLGRTINIHNRMNGYPKESEIYLFEPVTNSKWYERELSRLFSEKYSRGRLRSGELIGKEYFIGDVNEMIYNVRTFIFNNYPGRVGTFINDDDYYHHGNNRAPSYLNDSQSSEYSTYATDSETNSFIDDENDNYNQICNDDPYVDEINYLHAGNGYIERSSSATDATDTESTDADATDTDVIDNNYSIARCRTRRIIRSARNSIYSYS